MPIYNKLVRDHIPAIIKKDEKTPITQTLSTEHYITELQRKMHEELAEYEEAVQPEDQLEELADLLELLHAVAVVHGFSPEELEAVRAKKADARGGFSDRMYLVEVHDD